MDQLRRNKILLSAAVVIVAILAATSLLDRSLNIVPGTRTMKQASTAYLDDWTAKSLTTFAITKSINAALSVVEDSELQVAVVNIALGEAVRPLNDMVERVSSVAMASAVSLGIQRMLIEIGAWVGLKWFLTASMICWLVVIWVDSSIMRRLAYGLLLLALVARFLVPVAVLTTGYVGDRVTEDAYTKAQAELKKLDAEAQQVKGIETAADSSADTNIFGKAKNAIVGATNAIVGAKERISALASRLASQANAYNEVAVTYIVVFIMQTMLMPILILWGLVKLLGYLLSPAAVAGIEERWEGSVRGVGKRREKSQPTSEAATEAQG